MNDRTRRPALRFVTRQDCPLCDAGKERIDRWAPRLGFATEEVDVDGDPALRERFGDRVPVLLAGDRVVVEGRMPGPAVVAGLLRIRMLERSGRGGGAPPHN